MDRFALIVRPRLLKVHRVVTKPTFSGMTSLAGVRGEILRFDRQSMQVEAVQTIIPSAVGHSVSRISIGEYGRQRGDSLHSEEAILEYFYLDYIII